MIGLQFTKREVDHGATTGIGLKITADTGEMLWQAAGRVLPGLSEADVKGRLIRWAKAEGHLPADWTEQ